MQRRNIENERYEKLVAIKPIGINKQGAVIWLCKCDCGKETSISIVNWGKTKSCGCLRRKKKHDLSSTPEYFAWKCMLGRCNNPKTKLFKTYGARGITVCDEWQGEKGLFNFIKDMGPRPDNHSIDRIDNDGPYNKSNCRWATRTQQNRNKSDTTAITCNGETHCVSRWAEITGIPRNNIYKRLERGWTVERALGFSN